MFAGLRDRIRWLKRQVLTVYFIARDPRLPWPLRLLALAIAGYALSPIDLIPDFIPVLGLLDDLVLLPLGIALVMRLAPVAVVADARLRAGEAIERPVSRTAAWLIGGIWLLALAGAGYWGWRWWPP